MIYRLNIVTSSISPNVSVLQYYNVFTDQAFFPRSIIRHLVNVKKVFRVVNSFKDRSSCITEWSRLSGNSGLPLEIITLSLYFFVNLVHTGKRRSYAI